MVNVPPEEPAIAALPAVPPTALTLCVSPGSRSVSFERTPLAATVNVTFSDVVPPSATATGLSFTLITALVAALVLCSSVLPASVYVATAVITVPTSAWSNV